MEGIKDIKLEIKVINGSEGENAKGPI